MLTLANPQSQTEMEGQQSMQNLLTPAEKAASYLPLGSHPAGRAAWGAGVGAALTFGLKPTFMFNADGTPRPWILMNQNNTANPTMFPWWAGILAPAVLLGMFI